MTYRVLWTGWDEENKFGPCISEANRFNTYLFDYSSTKNYSLYFAYVPKTIVIEAEEWLQDYKSCHPVDFHFDLNEKVIDGKYLLYLQNSGISDIKLLQAEEFKDVPYEFENYQLAMCLGSRTISITENISEQKRLNKNIVLFHRIELFHNDDSASLTNYEFENQEKTPCRFLMKYFIEPRKE